ncbi:MAG: type 1 glutamine amidotransferase domain-containing protein [Kiritimatiellia bacterium]
MKNQKTVVVLAEDQYEDLELWYPVLRMREAGMTVVIVGPEAGQTYTSKHGYPVTSDQSADAIDPARVHALIVPGGYAPDLMRRYPEMVSLVRRVFERGGIVAAICHGGWMPASAGIVAGKRMTSFSSIRDDMVHAGAKWVDQEAVQDGQLITSRNPHDLPAFCSMILRALGTGN